MKVIVDANIVFSAILNTNGKIGNLLINATGLHFIAPDFLRTEIRSKYPKLIKLSGLSKENIIDAEYRICKRIDFIDEEQILPVHWLAAEKLVAEIDPNDIHYVAYARHFKCKIWSGDKALMKGLDKQGFKKFISTSDLYELTMQ
jgi:predicted nucleic acid-binding protein